MPRTCKLEAYIDLCEDRDILDLDELEFYSDVCGCADCDSMPPVLHSDDYESESIRLVS